ncbi:MAG: hypothetical protein ACRDNL_29160 [Spirillospora sp.]
MKFRKLAVALLTPTIAVSTLALTETTAHAAGFKHKCLDPVKASDDPGGKNVTGISRREGNSAEFFQVTFLAKGEKIRIWDRRDADGTPGPKFNVEVIDRTKGKTWRRPFAGGYDASGVYDLGPDKIGQSGNIKEGHKMAVLISTAGGGTTGTCKGGVS